MSSKTAVKSTIKGIKTQAQVAMKKNAEKRAKTSDLKNAIAKPHNDGTSKSGLPHAFPKQPKSKPSQLAKRKRNQAKRARKALKGGQ